MRIVRYARSLSRGGRRAGRVVVESAPRPWFVLPSTSVSASLESMIEHFTHKKTAIINMN